MKIFLINKIKRVNIFRIFSTFSLSLKKVKNGISFTILVGMIFQFKNQIVYSTTLIVYLFQILCSNLKPLSLKTSMS